MDGKGKTNIFLKKFQNNIIVIFFKMNMFFILILAEFYPKLTMLQIKYLFHVDFGPQIVFFK